MSRMQPSTRPVSQVTSACFGGPALDELYISTSTEGIDPSGQPAAGALFRVRAGHVGKPGALFAGVR
jgi:sugar lactone lactonase YvrE